MLLVTRKDQEGEVGNPRLHALSQAIVQLVSAIPYANNRYDTALPSCDRIRKIEDHPLVSFLPLDLSDPDSIDYVISHIDFSMQYGEDEEPKEVTYYPSEFR